MDKSILSPAYNKTIEFEQLLSAKQYNKNYLIEKCFNQLYLTDYQMAEIILWFCYFCISLLSTFACKGRYVLRIQSILYSMNRTDALDQPVLRILLSFLKLNSSECNENQTFHRSFVLFFFLVKVFL